MKCRIIYSVRRRRAQIKRLLHVRKRRAQKEPSNFAHSSADAHLRARRADIIYFSLYKHPAAEDKFHSASFLLMHLLWRSAVQRKNVSVLMHALLLGSKRKTDGTRFRKEKRHIPHTHTEPSCLVLKENGPQWTERLTNSYKKLSMSRFRVQEKIMNETNVLEKIRNFKSHVFPVLNIKWNKFKLFLFSWQAEFLVGLYMF